MGTGAETAMEQYDTIVVGAGSSSCVLANRLSADPHHRVSLIEAGGSNQSLFIRMAGGFVKITGKPEHFRAFPVVPRAGRRPELHAYGPGLGGSSAIIGTWFLPGMPADITLPGTQGIGRAQYTVDCNGRRASSYEAFVAPVRGHGNLRILTGLQVTRNGVSGGRRIGVVCDRDGAEVIVGCRGEVILAAGVYRSPHPLQPSGIGDGALPSRRGIAVARDVPAVGRNLADHHKLAISYNLHGDPGTNRECTGGRLYRNALRYLMSGTGPLARVGMPMTMLWSSEGAPADWPDFQLAAAPFAIRTVKEMSEKPGSPISDKPGTTFSGYHLRPRARGSVALTSPDWRAPPLVDSAMWSDRFDQDKARQLLKALRRLAIAPELGANVGAERVPGAERQSDEPLIEDLRQMVDPGLHGVGTCAMGWAGDGLGRRWPSPPAPQNSFSNRTTKSASGPQLTAPQ